MKVKFPDKQRFFFKTMYFTSFPVDNTYMYLSKGFGTNTKKITEI